MTLADDILACALALGFDRAAVLPVGPPRYAVQFASWLDAGYQGEMAYLAGRAAERLNPTRLAPAAASMIVVATNYNPGPSPQPLDSSPQGRIARYARRPDYHDLIKPKLFALDAFIRARTGRQALGKAFVDTAPVLERDFAEQAGLGFIGRNTCLITPGLGSWTVLAGLFVPEVLEAGSWKQETGNESRRAFQGCGRCTRCLDACPTRAFTAPHVLDARRCISYLTIELRGPIPRDLRPLMGGWVFGCDVCQEVCPYNWHAAQAGHSASDASEQGNRFCRAERVNDAGSDSVPGSLSLSKLLTLDDATFRVRFRGTPVLRAKRHGLVRNACVSAGTSRAPSLVPALIPLLTDPEPLVRGHAAWALGRIGGARAQRALTYALAAESDPWVREEFTLATA